MATPRKPTKRKNGYQFCAMANRPRLAPHRRDEFARMRLEGSTQHDGDSRLPNERSPRHRPACPACDAARQDPPCARGQMMCTCAERQAERTFHIQRYIAWPCHGSPIRPQQGADARGAEGRDILSQARSLGRARLSDESRIKFKLAIVQAAPNPATIVIVSTDPIIVADQD